MSVLVSHVVNENFQHAHQYYLQTSHENSAPKFGFYFGQIRSSNTEVGGVWGSNIFYCCQIRISAGNNLFIILLQFRRRKWSQSWTQPPGWSGISFSRLGPAEPPAKERKLLVQIRQRLRDVTKINVEKFVHRQRKVKILSCTL